MSLLMGFIFFPNYAKFNPLAEKNLAYKPQSAEAFAEADSVR